MADPIRRYVEAASTGAAISRHHLRENLTKVAGGVVGLLRSAYQATLGGPQIPGNGEDRQAP